MPSLPVRQSPIVPLDAPGQGDRMIAERMTPELAAKMLALVETSREALAFLDNLPMWNGVDTTTAEQEAADVALRLRAALAELGAVPGK